MITSILFFSIIGSWNLNGNPVCSLTGEQLKPISLPNDVLGFIAIWEDERNIYTGKDIYAQSVDFFGTPLWTTNGIPLCIAQNEQTNIRAINYVDKFIVVWQDLRNEYKGFDIYAQMIDFYGNSYWTNDGLIICNLDSNQINPDIAVDESSGEIIIVWEDYSKKNNVNIYAQKIDLLGNKLWGPNGVPVCTLGNDQKNPIVISDFNGGVIVLYKDYRFDINGDLYSQRIGNNGNILWSEYGIPVCNISGPEDNFKFVSDCAGGGIAVWEDSRNPYTGKDIYAQRIDLLGNSLWTLNGIPICNADSNQIKPYISSWGNDNIFIVWMDKRLSDFDIYAQRIDIDGNRYWTNNGRVICNAVNNQVNPIVSTDASKNPYIAWGDYRSGIDFDIYAQKVDEYGNIFWNTNGNRISSASGDENIYSLVNRESCVYILWEDNRHFDTNIFAQRVMADGQVGISVEKEQKSGTVFIFSGKLSIDEMKNEKISVYSLSGIKCGEYICSHIGEDLKEGIYFGITKGKIFKLIKINQR